MHAHLVDTCACAALAIIRMHAYSYIWRHRCPSTIAILVVHTCIYAYVHKLKGIYPIVTQTKEKEVRAICTCICAFSKFGLIIRAMYIRKVWKKEVPKSRSPLVMGVWATEERFFANHKPVHCTDQHRKNHAPFRDSLTTCTNMYVD